jgi:hypothetical protein
MLSRRENAQTFGITTSLLGGSFLLAALTHAVGGISLGTLAYEPRIVPAAAIELICGFALLAGAVGLIAHRGWAWPASLGAHLFAIVAVIVGIAAISMGEMPRTEAHMIFHDVVLVMLMLNLFGLWRTRPRNPLRRAQHHLAARLY